MKPAPLFCISEINYVNLRRIPVGRRSGGLVPPVHRAVQRDQGLRGAQRQKTDEKQRDPFLFHFILPNRHFVCQSSMLSSKKAVSRPHSFIHVR